MRDTVESSAAGLFNFIGVVQIYSRDTQAEKDEVSGFGSVKESGEYCLLAIEAVVLTCSVIMACSEMTGLVGTLN